MEDRQMTDFAAALKEGFDAAQRAVDARREVDEVFEQLDAQIRKTTEGRLTIKRDQREVKSGAPRDGLSAAMIRVGELLNQRPPARYWAIVASNPSVPEEEPVQLAKWFPASTGYPCRISWGEEEHICEDKKSLANFLADLLRDPEVAAILWRVKNWRPKEQETSDTETSGGLISADHTAGQETASDLPEAP
jgi:hypothetical protein